MDSTAFDVFSWKVLAGNPKTALTAPYTAVLTASMAKKYFGNENPIGKTLEGGLQQVVLTQVYIRSLRLLKMYLPILILLLMLYYP